MSLKSKNKVFNQSDVNNALQKVYAYFYLVPANKGANNVIVVCKKYYIERLVKQLGINATRNTKSTYILSTDSFDEILRSHIKFYQVSRPGNVRGGQKPSLSVVDSKITQGLVMPTYEGSLYH